MMRLRLDQLLNYKSRRGFTLNCFLLTFFRKTIQNTLMTRESSKKATQIAIDNTILSCKLLTAEYIQVKVRLFWVCVVNISLLGEEMNNFPSLLFIKIIGGGKWWFDPRT